MLQEERPVIGSEETTLNADEALFGGSLSRAVNGCLVACVFAVPCWRGAPAVLGKKELKAAAGWPKGM